MTYKTDLQTNNTNLQSILDKVNALPEAGEIVEENVTLDFSWTATSSTYRPTVFYSYYEGGYSYRSNQYTPSSGTSGNTSISVAKNSIIIVICKGTTNTSYGVETASTSGGVEKVSSDGTIQGYQSCTYIIYSSGTLNVSMGSISSISGGSV